MDTEKKDIGALWQKVSKQGKTYLSGTINGQRVVVFKNERKQEGERTPDWRIYPETPRDDAAPVAPATSHKSSMREPDIAFHTSPTRAEDIPFVWMLPYLALMTSSVL